MAAKNLVEHVVDDKPNQHLSHSLDKSVDQPLNPPPIPINPNLVWDYDVPVATDQSEAFRRWYIARVLSRGGAEDLRAIGFDLIRAYLPALNLPSEIRHFWEWYFNLPEMRERYGAIHATST